jgi:hypothetical protein
MRVVDVFISYKKERRAFVERLAAVLEAHGLDVFWDHELVVGPNYTFQLESKLREAKAVLVLWCTGSRRSTYVIDEARIARQAGKLVPALIEPVEPPLGFGGDQMALLLGWDGAPDGDGVARIVASVERLCGRPAKRFPNMLAMLARGPQLDLLQPIVEPEPPPPPARPAQPTLNGGAHAASPAGASGDDEEMAINGLTPEQLRDQLQRLGYRGEIKRHENATMITSKMSGFNVSFNMYPPGAPVATSLQVRVYITKSPEIRPEKVAEYNENTRFTKVYIDKDGDLALEHDFFVTGISEKAFDDNIEIFDTALTRLRHTFT